jgi:hypothetical protein
MQNESLATETFKRSNLRSAILLKTDASGLTSTTVVYEKKRKRRVSSRWRGLDKAIRKISTAQEVAASDFLNRHERSNQKKKNGGLRDLMKNLSKSSRKGRKKLKIRIF